MLSGEAQIPVSIAFGFNWTRFELKIYRIEVNTLTITLPMHADVNYHTADRMCVIDKYIISLFNMCLKVEHELISLQHLPLQWLVG